MNKGIYKDIGIFLQAANRYGRALQSLVLFLQHQQLLEKVTSQAASVLQIGDCGLETQKVTVEELRSALASTTGQASVVVCNQKAEHSFQSIQEELSQAGRPFLILYAGQSEQVGFTLFLREHYAQHATTTERNFRLRAKALCYLIVQCPAAIQPQKGFQIPEINESTSSLANCSFFIVLHTPPSLPVGLLGGETVLSQLNMLYVNSL